MTIQRTDQLPASLLIIERDPLLLAVMGSVMHRQGHRAVLARTEEVALEAILQGQFDLIVLSIDAVDAGRAFADRLRSTPATDELPIIFLVPQTARQQLGCLESVGGIYSLFKPIDPYALIELVDKAVWMPHVAKARVSPPNLHAAPVADWLKLE